MLARKDIHLLTLSASRYPCSPVRSFYHFREKPSTNQFRIRAFAQNKIKSYAIQILIKFSTMCSLHAMIRP